MSGSPSPLPHPPLDQRGLPTGYAFRPELEVTPRAVRQAMHAGPDALVVVDCRRPDEWAVARIEGAVLIPLSELERRADELEDDNGGRARPIVVYCHHGRRSLRATSMLRAVGFTDVRSMAGGIDLWSIDIDAAVPRY